MCHASTWSVRFGEQGVLNTAAESAAHCRGAAPASRLLGRREPRYRTGAPDFLVGAHDQLVLDVDRPAARRAADHELVLAGRGSGDPRVEAAADGVDPARLGAGRVAPAEIGRAA